jgi:hypothetical protein
MVMKNILVAIIFMLYANSAFGQTASDIEMKYGKPVMAYAVSEHIWMTPEYAVDGQVCQMRLYPRRIAVDTNYFSRSLPFEELKGVLNQLVPLNTRGTKKESFGISATGGGAAWTTYPYEKVTFIFTSSFKVDPDSFQKLKPFVFSVKESPFDMSPENLAPSDEDFFRSQSSSAEFVTITWSDRTCGGK